MKKMNAAVIGVGNMGQQHARIYHQIKNVQLLAVCDSNKKRVLERASKYKTHPFTDYHHLLKSFPQIDVVSIAVPTKLHQKIACFFLENKVNVLLEKPISHTLKQAEKIIKTAKANQVKLTIGHVERFNPAVIALKKIIKENKLGKIISIIARRVGVFPPLVKDANVLIDLAVHDVDIINYLLEKTPTEIYKHSARFHTKNQEDTAEIFLFYNDTAAFIQTNWVTPVKIRKLAVTGTKGYAELDYISQELIIHQAKVKKEFSGFSEFLKFSNPVLKKSAVKKEEPLKLEIKAFIENIIKNTEPLVTGEEALKSLEICLKP